jgi:predicted anti-sigma-YlaC factor YlaD
MPDTHIIRTLEEKPFDSLSGDDIASVESHIAICDECKSAYDAARIAAGLLQARTAETVDVGPFFQTRVMAGIREGRL